MRTASEKKLAQGHAHGKKMIVTLRSAMIINFVSLGVCAYGVGDIGINQGLLLGENQV